MAKRTSQLEREVAECRAQLDAHIAQLQTQAEDAREESGDRVRRMSYWALLAGAAIGGYALYRAVQRNRTTARG